MWGGRGGRGACAGGGGGGGGGGILGEVKARPKDIISFSLDYISKSKVQTSNPSSSPIPLDTPARPADLCQFMSTEASRYICFPLPLTVPLTEAFPRVRRRWHGHLGPPRNRGITLPKTIEERTYIKSEKTTPQNSCMYLRYATR